MSDPTLVSLVHLGCARNLIDSELMLGRLAEEGLVVTDDVDLAHTVVVNTCSFIGAAREESDRAIRELVERKRAGGLERVVVAGCLVNRYKRDLQGRYPEVDLFCEISDYRGLARSVRGMAQEGAPSPAYLEAGPRDGAREGARLLATPGSYAYLRISHGCDHTCAFCAIPSFRGKHRSKRPSAVVEEARELLGSGARELVLVAEDSTAWGRDLGLELPDLIEELAELDGLLRLRILYAYPNRFPWRLTRLLREHPRVASYLDIPVQHASTPVLRRMARAGSGDQVRRILDRLLDEVPGIVLRSTLLVGFPGETDEDAEQAVELVRAYGLGRLGAFVFSPEEGTPSFTLPDRVPARVAQARYDAVLAERDRQLARSQAALVGSELEVLVDEVGPEGELVARAELDAPEVDPFTVVRGVDAEVGDVLRVRVESVDERHNLHARAVGPGSA